MFLLVMTTLADFVILGLDVLPLTIKSIHRYGLMGRSCLLRSICEIAEIPVYYNGLIGELLHVIFT